MIIRDHILQAQRRGLVLHANLLRRETALGANEVLIYFLPGRLGRLGGPVLHFPGLNEHSHLRLQVRLLFTGLYGIVVAFLLAWRTLETGQGSACLGARR